MTDTAGTWFRERTADAGFADIATLARSIDAMPHTAQGWARGDSKPERRYLDLLAQALGASVEDLVLHLWGEVVGAPCNCPRRCGGRKVIPPMNHERASTARSLWTTRVCPKCQKSDLWDSNKSVRDHSMMCLSCKNRMLFTAPTDTFTCVGYRDGKSTRHACKPPHEKRLTAAAAEAEERRNRTTEQKRWGKKPAHYSPKRGHSVFYNTKTHDYRCGRCSLAAMAFETQKMMVRERDESAPRIRDRKGLAEELSGTNANTLIPGFAKFMAAQPSAVAKSVEVRATKRAERLARDLPTMPDEELARRAASGRTAHWVTQPILNAAETIGWRGHRATRSARQWRAQIDEAIEFLTSHLAFVDELLPTKHVLHCGGPSAHIIFFDESELRGIVAEKVKRSRAVGEFVEEADVRREILAKRRCKAHFVEFQQSPERKGLSTEPLPILRAAYRPCAGDSHRRAYAWHAMRLAGIPSRTIASIFEGARPGKPVDHTAVDDQVRHLRCYLDGYDEARTR